MILSELKDAIADAQYLGSKSRVDPLVNLPWPKAKELDEFIGFLLNEDPLVSVGGFWGSWWGFSQLRWCR